MGICIKFSSFCHWLLIAEVCTVPMSRCTHNMYVFQSNTNQSTTERKAGLDSGCSIERHLDLTGLLWEINYAAVSNYLNLVQPKLLKYKMISI